MDVNGIAISITPLDAAGKPLDKPALYVWTPSKIAELEANTAETGGAMAHIGKATSAEVRRALTMRYPKLVVARG